MTDWLTADDLRHFLFGENDDASGDAIRLADAIGAAMEQVEDKTGREWGDVDPLPGKVRLATLLQAARLFKRQEATFGIAAVGTVDSTTGMRLLSKLDADAEKLLEAYVDYSAL